MEIFGLTIPQPLAWLTAQGHRRIDNRVWRPPAGLTVVEKDCYVAIYARKRLDRDAMAEAQQTAPEIELPTRYEMGAIIGVGYLRGVVEAWEMAAKWEYDLPFTAKLARRKLNRRWFRGPYGLVISQAHPIEPIPCRSGNGNRLWELPPTIRSLFRENFDETLASNGTAFMSMKLSETSNVPLSLCLEE